MGSAMPGRVPSQHRSRGLTKLDIGGNRIGDAGARAIAASLKGLMELNLGGNNISEGGVVAFLDMALASGMAKSLRHLTLRGYDEKFRPHSVGTIAALPAELLRGRDAPAIFAAYQRAKASLHSGAISALNEAKLLVVGNEAVGKTSLIRYLVENRPRNTSEPKTPNIAIRERIQINDWIPRGCSVTLHAWDFGGQEMMHGTHRFFLTERSLYLIVLEARKEDDRSIYDWLKTVRTHGGDSPVIVVINKDDLKDHHLDLNESGLQKDYPNIVGFVKASCDPGSKAAESIARLRELIAKHIGD